MPIEALSRFSSLSDKIIVALDVDRADAARRLRDELRGHVGGFKIGSQLFTATGPDLVREFTDAGLRVFLDLKFHDIPNTVAGSAVEAARLGVWMFNVHCSGGGEMMRQAVSAVDKVCESEQLGRPLIIGVTVLTSSNAESMSDVGVADAIDTQVSRLASLAARCGLNGVVASAADVPAIRRAVSLPGFLTVTPGIRGAFATGDDQKRVTTFRQAMVHGSDYVVIGRPIVSAVDRVAAVEQIVGER